MFLLLITIGMCVAYGILHIGLPLFFKNTLTPFRAKSLLSIALIFILSLVINLISVLIPDPEIGNRILHAFGGGFTAFFVCFLATRDTKLNINKFQFFIISFLVVIALGVVNEIIEYFFQTHLNYIMSTSIEDTWLDLMSNTVGALIAAILFTPFIKKYE